MSYPPGFKSDADAQVFTADMPLIRHAVPLHDRARQPIRAGRSMRKCAAILIALAGFYNPASAQTQCPELIRLRTEAAAASTKTTGVPTQNRCDAYIRLSIAWNDIAKYAGNNREACGISISAMNDIERRHRDAVQARDNVCTGRRPRPFPAEIFLR